MRAAGRSDERQQVSHFLLLGLEVSAGILVGGDFEGYPLDDLEAVPPEGRELAGIVGQHADLPASEVAEDLRPDAVVPVVGLESELVIGLDGVPAPVLQLIGAQL